MYISLWFQKVHDLSEEIYFQGFHFFCWVLRSIFLLFQVGQSPSLVYIQCFPLDQYTFGVFGTNLGPYSSVDWDFSEENNDLPYCYHYCCWNCWGDWNSAFFDGIDFASYSGSYWYRKHFRSLIIFLKYSLCYRYKMKDLIDQKLKNCDATYFGGLDFFDDR